MSEPSLDQLRRMDAAVVAVAAALPSAVTVSYFVALDGFPTWMQQAAWVLGKLVQFGLPVAWVLLRARLASSRAQWFWPRGGGAWRRGLGLGVASGAIVFVGLLAVYYGVFRPAGILEEPAIAMREKLAGMALDSFGRYVAFAVFLSVAHSFLEEYYFRWFLFGQMRRLLPLPTALVLASLAFAAHHVFVLAVFFGWTSPLLWLGVAGVAVAGAFWAWLYERSGSLLGPWVSHLLVDAALMTVGYQLLALS